MLWLSEGKYDCDNANDETRDARLNDKYLKSLFQIAPTVKSPQNRSVTTTSLVEKGGGVPKSGRGRPTAPVKENR